MIDIEILKDKIKKEKFIQLDNEPFDKDKLISMGLSLGAGRLWENPPIYGRNVDDKYVVEVKATSDPLTVGFGQHWHNDGSYIEDVPAGNILHIVQAPSKGGYTQFIDTVEVLNRLPPSLLNDIKDLNAYHDHGKSWKYGRKIGRFPDQELPRVLHPIIKESTLSGEKALFVNRLLTSEIEGLSKIESTKILKELFKYLYDETYVVALRANTNSIIVWDNITTQHRAVNDYFPETRIGYRVSYY